MVIAIAIMVIAFTAIFSVESNSIKASMRAKQMNIISMLAKSAMVDVEIQMEGKLFDDLKKEDQKTFPAPFENYSWKYEIKEIEFPNLSPNQSAASKNSPGSGGGSGGGGGSTETSDVAETMTKLVTQFFSKSIRSVIVTVFWKEGESEQSYSLSTYWVDLNRDFQLTQ